MIVRISEGHCKADDMKRVQREVQNSNKAAQRGERTLFRGGAVGHERPQSENNLEKWDFQAVSGISVTIYIESGNYSIPPTRYHLIAPDANVREGANCEGEELSGIGSLAQSCTQVTYGPFLTREYDSPSDQLSVTPPRYPHRDTLPSDIR